MFKRLAAACALAIAVTANVQSIAATPVDCLFNWAATSYPSLFSPAGTPSSNLGPYYFRYYPQTNSFLATSSVDFNLYYLGAQSNFGVVNLGAASDLLTAISCVNAASAAGGWTFDGTIFSTSVDFGGARGSLADTTVIPLRDGRYRMFIGGVPVTPATPQGIHSAISSDGVRFTLEIGPRIATPYPIPGATTLLSHPHVVRMDDGRVRLYSNGGAPIGGVPSKVIYSFTSSDEGMTFTLDPGFRVRAIDVGISDMTGPSIVKMKTGGWRMYFSEFNPSITDPITGFITLVPNRVFSAFSTDLLNWTIDPGVRAGPGSAIPNSLSGGHPASIVNDDGSVTLIYLRLSPPGPFVAATSVDGLNFTREIVTPIVPGNDAFLLRLNTGEVRIYYNWGDNNGGAIYTARHPPFSASTSP